MRKSYFNLGRSYLITTVILGMQQYALPKRRQRKQGSAVCLPKLWLQANCQQQLHLCEQNYARSWRVDQYRFWCHWRSHTSKIRGTPMSQMQTSWSRLFPGIYGIFLINLLKKLCHLFENLIYREQFCEYEYWNSYFLCIKCTNLG